LHLALERVGGTVLERRRLEKCFAVSALVW